MPLNICCSIRFASTRYCRVSLPFRSSMRSAAEMMSNVIAMLLVIGANTIARKASDTSLY